MPRLNPFDQIVDKVTNECNTSEDWSLIMDVCDKVKNSPSGPKDCLRSVIRRLSCPDPHVVLLALTLLDACIKNCGRSFHLEVCSRSFEEELKKMLHKKSHPKVVDKVKNLIKKWVEEDFKNDPQLSLMSSLYNGLKSDGMDFNCEEAISLNKLEDNPNVVTSQQEEEDIAKAIELSLKETVSSPKSGSSLYPIACPPSPSSAKKSDKEPKKVRALHDFEAAEDNELTFKAGEIVLVLDNSDPNWWKGSNHRGEGLFPSNFVTADLAAEPEMPVKTEKKSVQFSEEVKVKTVEKEQELEIDENKIDRVLHMLHEADPTQEEPQSEDIKVLEEQCMGMGPLIDQKLDYIDRRNAALATISQQLNESLNLYHHLMKESASQNYLQYVPNQPTVMHSYPPQMYINPASQSYINTEQYMPVSAPNSMEPYPSTGTTGQQGLPAVLPHQVPYSASMSFSSIPPNSAISSAYSVAGNTAPIISPYYTNTGGNISVSESSPQQHGIPPHHMS